MGRSRNNKPRKGISRRDFLTRSALAGLALGGSAFARTGTAGAAAPADASTNPFQHGVASGDPLSDRVILWTRISTSSADKISVDYRWSTDPAMLSGVKTGSTKTSSASDYTVKVDLKKLKPGKTYYYQFSALGYLSPVGRTRTLPTGSPGRLRIGVACCASLAHGYFNAYARLAARNDLAAVLHLGDYLYEYGSGEYGNVREYQPANEIITLTDYRTRHAQYKTDADLQELHRQHPVIAVWDDHETANNAWSGGAQNHDEATEGTWAQRVAAALQAYYEWMPVRHASDTDPKLNYRRFQFGDLADVMMTETRLLARSQQLPPNQGATFTQTGDFADPSRELLGSTQADWLSQQLRTSPCQWKLLGQQVMLAQLKIAGAPNAAGTSRYVNPDQWDGYNPARERLFAVLKGDESNAPVGNVVVLTGDIHSSWGADLTEDPNNPNVATGGYDPKTGEGSLAVEFVSTSVTSPGLDSLPKLADVSKKINPHFKYAEVTRRGYLLLDVKPERVSGEWWYVDTILDPASTGETFAAAYKVGNGKQHLQPSEQSTPMSGPPPAP